MLIWLVKLLILPHPTLMKSLLVFWGWQIYAEGTSLPASDTTSLMNMTLTSDVPTDSLSNYLPAGINSNDLSRLEMMAQGKDQPITADSKVTIGGAQTNGDHAASSDASSASSDDTSTIGQYVGIGIGAAVGLVLAIVALAKLHKWLKNQEKEKNAKLEAANSKVGKDFDRLKELVGGLEHENGESIPLSPELAAHINYLEALQRKKEGPPQDAKGLKEELENITTELTKKAGSAEDLHALKMKKIELESQLLLVPESELQPNLSRDLSNKKDEIEVEIGELEKELASPATSVEKKSFLREELSALRTHEAKVADHLHIEGLEGVAHDPKAIDKVFAATLSLAVHKLGEEFEKIPKESQGAEISRVVEDLKISCENIAATYWEGHGSKRNAWNKTLREEIGESANELRAIDERKQQGERLLAEEKAASVKPNSSDKAPSKEEPAAELKEGAEVVGVLDEKAGVIDLRAENLEAMVAERASGASKAEQGRAERAKAFVAAKAQAAKEFLAAKGGGFKATVKSGAQKLGKVAKQTKDEGVSMLKDVRNFMKKEPKVSAAEGLQHPPAPRP